MNAYKLLIGLVILLTRGWNDDRTDPTATTSTSPSPSSSTSQLSPSSPTAPLSFASPSPPPPSPSSPRHASRSHKVMPDREQMMMTSLEEEEEEEDDDEEEEEEEEDYGSPAESGGGGEEGDEEERGGRRRRSRSGEEHEEEPYFDASMSPEYVAYLGKTATLTCIVHATKSDKTVTWIRSRDLRILSVGRYTYVSDLRFEALHQEGSSQWTLRIKSVQLRDVGTYECQITTKPIKTFKVFLKVVEPSVEILGAPDLYVNRASMINLTCVVYHAPVPPASIEWYHDNKSISYTSPRGGVSVVEERGETTSSFLLLQNARPTDSGTFTCKPRGFQTTSINLHVLDGEHPAAMQTNSSTAGATTRSLVVFLALTCVVATVNVL